MDSAPFDIITANAIFYGFDIKLFKSAISNLSKMLNPTGSIIAFDYFSPFNQELTITETTKVHPEGLTIHVKSFIKTQEILKDAGFSHFEFRNFNVKKELPLNNFEQTTTYTIPNKQLENMSFRGSMFQPWHHLIASRA